MSLDQDAVWLITGCSTGFGRELARILLDRGNKVVATARNVSAVTDLVSGHEGTALALALDVTKPDEIRAATAAALERFGRIDVLVNNAGFGYLAAVEEGDETDIRDMFEANVFGLAAMTRAVLPSMRGRRSGAIVNISSMGGLVSFPGIGYYNASKYAVEGLSEALAQEVEPLGIKVLIVEPGPFRTDWAGRSLKTPKVPIEDYAQTAIARRQRTQSYSGQQPGDPVRAAEAIVTAVEAENTPLRLVLGKIALAAVRGKLAAVAKDIDAWEDVSTGADFPEATVAQTAGR
jgi:NAD(P)-dependent dehydrogenase (short-subunit alcohol dehydrogenase family)